MKGESSRLASGFTGTVGDVYTCCVDVEKKLFYMFLFGELLGPPKKITLTDEQL